MTGSDIDDPDMTLDLLMSLWPETIPVFMRHKMICIGCAIGPYHTITDACREHDIAEEPFRIELRRAIDGDL